MRTLTIGLMAMLLGGLATTSQADVVSKVGAYAEDRANDFLDIFRIRGGFPRDGRGIGAKARVTSLAQIGYVYFDGKYAGLDRRAVGIVDERRREFGLSLAYGSWNEMEPVAGNVFLMGESDWHMLTERRIVRNLPYWDDGRKRHFSIGGEIATPLFAVDLGLYPEEAIDFVLGIFTIDVFRDDKARDYVVIRQEPSTLPIPDGNSPFAERRARYASIVEEMRLRREVEANMASGTLTFTTRDGQTSTVLDSSLLPATGIESPAVPAQIPGFETGIREEDVQSTLSLLELLEQGIPVNPRQ